jgi:hypothetical protein
MMEDESAFLSFFQPGKETRDAALAYATLGLFVFPLRSLSKEPLTKHGFKDATTRADLIKQWWPVGSSNNIGIALQLSSTVVIDVDPRNNGEENFRTLIAQHGSLPDTYQVRTAGGGFHLYYRVSPDFYEDDTYYPKKLASGVELLIRGYVVAPPSEVEGKSYSIEDGDPEVEFTRLPISWLESVKTSITKQYDSQWQPESEHFRISKGERNNILAAFAGKLRNDSLKESTIAKMLQVLAEDYVDDYEEILNEIPTIAHSICRYPPKGVPLYDRGIRIRKTVHKPVLDEVALHGPIGKWVIRTQPYTEAHPAALLITALTVFGNMIGARDYDDVAPGFTVEGAHHTTGLYALIIGPSGEAAKGDSLSQVKRFLLPVDPTWPHVTGVQTGEGIVDLMADDQPTGDISTIQGDKVEHVRKGGQRDRRLCVIEDEFGRVLHTSKRLGSVTKDVYKSMWDTGSTANITASSKKIVTGATLSFISHVTPTELQTDTTDSDFLNGFLNRFILIYAERTQDLPEAQGLTNRKLYSLREHLQCALEVSRTESPWHYRYSEDAQPLRDEIHYYWKNIETVDPIVDAMRTRARANIRRLAIIYAVSCMHDEVEYEDLLAANAIYQYHYDTVMYLFSQFVGDTDANKLLRALIANPAGVDWTDAYNKVFNKSNNALKRLQHATDILIERGLAVVDKIRKPGSHKESRIIRYIHPPNDPL